MAPLTVAEADNHLSELIDRALSGEQIFITRDGRPVIEVKPVPQGPRPLTAADLDWLAEQRARGRSRPRTPARRSAASATNGDFAPSAGPEQAEQYFQPIGWQKAVCSPAAHGAVDSAGPTQRPYENLLTP
jgi:prevent-host-death family protein